MSRRKSRRIRKSRKKSKRRTSEARKRVSRRRVSPFRAQRSALSRKRVSRTRRNVKYRLLSRDDFDRKMQATKKAVEESQRSRRELDENFRAATTSIRKQLADRGTSRVAPHQLTALRNQADEATSRAEAAESRRDAAVSVLQSRVASHREYKAQYGRLLREATDRTSYLEGEYLNLESNYALLKRQYDELQKSREVLSSSENQVREASFLRRLKEETDQIKVNLNEEMTFLKGSNSQLLEENMATVRRMHNLEGELRVSKRQAQEAESRTQEAESRTQRCEKRIQSIMNDARATVIIAGNLSRV